jgi:acyl CoA:acetate/3-ketoacid CoA transferase alpha subunit/acyl CoA:acetate/3-ketoacid CoA transferase beta subunit
VVTGTGADRRREPADAVREHVEPGAAVHFSFTHNRSHALACELARQFRGRRSLQLVATGVLDYAIVLAAAGALRSSVSAFAGMTYPAAAPSPPAAALASAAGSDPHWTNLTVTLRLMAGALGLPAIPTASLAGSGLVDGPGRAVVPDPFGDGTLTLLEPLRPDVAFLHAPVADTEGNTLVQGPLGEDLWGAWAARHVVVSAERVVSPAELRAMGPAAGLPASRVDAVVHAPYGAHPQAQFAWDARLGVRPYAEDYAFRDALRAAARDAGALERWLGEWVLDGDHTAYLGRLGSDRLRELHDAAEADAPPPREPVKAPVSASETAAAVGVRWLVERLRRDARPHRPLFAGIGLSHLVAFAAARAAERVGVPVQLVAEVGMMGFTPSDGDPYLFSAANVRSALLHADFVRMLGTVGGPNDHGTITVLAAGQIDRHGALNSSFAADGGFIVGSGGANDLAAGASELLVVVPLSPRRTAAELPFVTARPRRLRAVATDHGVLEPGEDGELRLTAVVAEAGQVERAIDAARAACGWPLRTGERVTRLDPPSAPEVAALRVLDPERRLLR